MKIKNTHFMKIKNTHFMKIKKHISWKSKNTFHENQNTHFMKIKTHISRKSKHTFHENQETRFIFSRLLFVRKSFGLWGNVEECVAAKEATDDYGGALYAGLVRLHALKHTLVTMHPPTLHVHCLSCCTVCTRFSMSTVLIRQVVFCICKNLWYKHVRKFYGKASVVSPLCVRKKTLSGSCLLEKLSTCFKKEMRHWEVLFINRIVGDFNGFIHEIL
jgi:hypothetical protein